MTTFSQTLAFKRRENDETVQTSEMYVSDHMFEILGPSAEFETKVVDAETFTLHLDGENMIEVFKSIYMDSTWPPFA